MYSFKKTTTNNFPINDNFPLPQDAKGSSVPLPLSDEAIEKALGLDMNKSESESTAL